MHSEKNTARDYYRTIARRIAGGFAGVPMGEVTTAQVQAWENGMVESGLAPSTVIKHHCVLNAVFRHAIAVRDLDWNPCMAVKVPKRARPKPNSLTTEGYARLAVTLEQLEPSAVVTAAAIALYTGVREGEACAVRWRNWDREAGTITVEASVGKDGGKTYLKSTKTDAVRTVPVAPQLAGVLSRRRQMMVEELEVAGVSLDEAELGELFVLGYPDGRYYNPLFLCKVWREFAEAFGLVGTQGRRLTFHDLLNSFASVTIAAGADVRAVSAALGVGSERNIRRMCEHGEVRAVKVGNRWKINTKALLAQFGLA